MAYMAIKNSGVMVKYIKSLIPEDYTVKMIKLPEDRFKWLVDYDIYNNDRDYDENTDMYKVILVEYPDEYYASPKYITTKELNYIYNSSVKHNEDFKDNLLNSILI